MLRDSVRILAAAACFALVGAFMVTAVVTPAVATTPVRPSDTGLLISPPPPEWPEDIIDRFSKLAADALANCNEPVFNFWRAALRSMVSWVKRHHASNWPLFPDWQRYLDEVISWQFVRPPACPPAAAGTGQALLVPLPEQPALQPRTFQGDGNFNFVHGMIGTNVSTDNQSDCEFSTATPALTVLLPVDASGNPLLPLRDAPASPGGPVTASNPPSGSEAPTAAPTTAKPTPPTETSKPPGETAPASDPPTTAGGDKPIYIGPIPPGTLPGLPKAGVSSGEYAPSPGASLEPIPAPSGDTPKTTAPGDTKKDGQPTNLEPGSKPPTAAPGDAPKTATPASIALWQHAAHGEPLGSSATPEEIKKWWDGLKPSQDPPPPADDSILNEIDEVPVISSNAPPKPDPNAGGVITIAFKATPAAIQAGLEGKEQTSDLVMLTALEPAMPTKDKSTKATQDKDFDKKALKCALGKDKECTVRLDPAEAATLGIPAEGPRIYQVFVTPSKTASGVIEKPAGALAVTPPAIPPGAQVTQSDFKIGDQEFSRIDVTGSDAAMALVMASYSKAYGPLFTINFCREKKLTRCLAEEARSPHAAPASVGAMQSELPHETIKLAPDARVKSAAR